MLLRLGYDIRFKIPSPVAMVALLNVHPSRVADLRAPDDLRVEPATPVEDFIDSFGNRCARFVAQQGAPISTLPLMRNCILLGRALERTFMSSSRLLGLEMLSQTGQTEFTAICHQRRRAAAASEFVRSEKLEWTWRNL